jgi:hypothetical protein
MIAITPFDGARAHLQNKFGGRIGCWPTEARAALSGARSHAEKDPMRNPAIVTAVVMMSLCATPLWPAPRATAGTEEVTRHEAELIISFPIEGDFGARVEPSGLAFHQGFLYTVSDEHDNIAFKLMMTVEEHGGEASLKLAGIPFSVPQAGGEEGMDFEGIASDGRDGFYLLSEEHARVWHLDLSRPRLRPVTGSLQDRGKAHGLFQAGSAGLEGITRSGQKLILCAERRPRALIELDLSAPNPPELTVQKDVETFSEFTEGADEDFAALFSEGDTLYVLERNAYAVCRLHKSEGLYRPQAAVFYGGIIDEHGLRYSRKERETIDYGRGEGLALDADRIYIMLDNNGRPLKSNPADTKARLLVLNRPDGF